MNIPLPFTVDHSVTIVPRLGNEVDIPIPSRILITKIGKNPKLARNGINKVEIALINPYMVNVLLKNVFYFPLA